jgi:hypothetical protein
MVSSKSYQRHNGSRIGGYNASSHFVIYTAMAEIKSGLIDIYSNRSIKVEETTR